MFAQCDNTVSTVKKSREKTLAKKLATVLVLKLAVLLALWWGFVRDQRVTVDAQSVATQFLQRVPAPTSGVTPSTTFSLCRSPSAGCGCWPSWKVSMS